MKCQSLPSEKVCMRYIGVSPDHLDKCYVYAKSFTPTQFVVNTQKNKNIFLSLQQSGFFL